MFILPLLLSEFSLQLKINLNLRIIWNYRPQDIIFFHTSALKQETHIHTNSDTFARLVL